MTSVLEYLNSLGETKIDFNFQLSVDLNKNFFKKLPVVAICGTNGKGSTTAFLENILIQAGYKVGAYTSPHLEHLRERIRINGESISEDLFEKYGQEFRKIIDSKKITPTYFEFLTFLALDIFQKEKIDIAIFEVGLGGRLDSVNAIPRIGAILTSISLDHQSYLGDTIVKIAKEKLPILKGSPFSVVSKQNFEIEEVIAATLQKSYLTEGKDFQHSGNSEMFIYRKEAFQFGPIQLGLRADHQTSNAACATTMAIYLQNRGWKIKVEHLEKGLTTTRNPGRIEKWIGPNQAVVWLDVAHNPDAMDKLVQYLYLKELTEFHTVFGCSSDKPWEIMIETLIPITKTFHWVSTPTPRSWAPDDRKLEDPLDCLQELVKQKQPRILCTGSFYHVGFIRQHLPELGYLLSI